MPGADFTIERLKGASNYHNWTFAMENFLEAKGLGDSITPMKDDTTKPKETDADKLNKAKGFLVVGVDSQLYVHIRQYKSAFDMWNKLKSMYEDRGLVRKIGLLRNLISMRLDSSDSMQTYIDQITDSISKLDSIGFKVEDDWAAAILLAGLTDEYKPLIMTFEGQSDKITSKTIKMKLLDTQNATESNDSAFFSKKSHNSSKTIQHEGKTCYNCNGKNHISSNCPKKQQQQQKKGKSTAKRGFMATTAKQQLDEWFVDSGGSYHMTPDVSLLSNRTHSPVNEVSAANDARMAVKCKGETAINLDSGKVSVKNVLFIPELSANLLLVYRMVQAGNSIVFNKDGCTIYDQNNVPYVNCKPEDGFYELKSSLATCLLSKQDQNSALTWHRRFGHLNINSLKKMRNGKVTGMTFKNSIINMANCEVCAKAKQARLPFTASETQSKHLLEIIHSDLVGPMETKSFGGARYLLTFIDDFSRKVFVYFLSQKSEVLETFIEFKAFVEKQTEKKIKIFRTDNGTEYCSRRFNAFIKANGIQHQLTNAYTPEQNGVAERMNRTIIERAKCTIFDADLNDNYWAEACNMAVYVINRSVCAALPDKTPEEVWTGQKVDVSHLKIFGTPVMVHVPKQKRRKWSAKSVPMIFVGYDNDKKGFRCLNERNKLTVSRDVIFNEKPPMYYWKVNDMDQVSESGTECDTESDPNSS